MKHLTAHHPTSPIYQNLSCSQHIVAVFHRYYSQHIPAELLTSYCRETGGCINEYPREEKGGRENYPHSSLEDRVILFSLLLKCLIRQRGKIRETLLRTILIPFLSCIKMQIPCILIQQPTSPFLSLFLSFLGLHRRLLAAILDGHSGMLAVGIASFCRLRH